MGENRKTVKVRICGYAADWLKYRGESFNNRKEIIWSTGAATQLGDIQVFGISSTLGDRPDLATDRRVDAVHSIWVALGPPKAKYGNSRWPVQAEFKLLVKLQNLVGKDVLLRSGILQRQWPRHWQGKILHQRSDVRKLAEVLAKRNPQQRRKIFSALGLAH